MKSYFVYILASKRHGTLYIGCSSNLSNRGDQHISGEGSKFTKKYKVDRLVYYEIHEDVREALLREKQLKKWNRQWKIELIEKDNPEWEDLFYTLV